MYLGYNCNTSRFVKRAHNGIIVRRHSLKGQRGSVLVYVTLMLATIFSFAALAIDVGYLFVVRSELQNAADAVALTIAGRLYPLNGSQPNWTAAKTYENAAITLNKAASAQLTDGQVDYGYWNITGSPSPSWRSLPHTPVANDFPAVKVTISKTSAHNGGGVNTVFARVLGINSLDASATAVAVVASPGYIMAGAELPNHKKQDIFPVVITKCMYNNYWNSRTNQPTTNPPTTFTVGSSYHYSGCEGGQWTSLNLDTNNVPDIRKLIDYASGALTNPSPAKFSIGDNIWIQPGDKNHTL